MTIQIAGSKSRQDDRTTGRQDDRTTGRQDDRTTSIVNKDLVQGKSDASGTRLTLSESSHSARKKDELPAWTREAAGHYDAMFHDDAVKALESYATADNSRPMVDITRIQEGIITDTHTGERVTPESKERYDNIGKNLTDTFTSIFNAEKDKNTSPGDIFLKVQE